MRTKVLHSGRVGKFCLERAALPGGKSATFEVVRHPGAAAVCAFLDESTVLLLRQYRHAAGGTIWEVPAGKLDSGEAPERCAARELEEETGYRAGRLQKLPAILTTPGFSDERIHLFAAFNLQRTTQQLEAHEVIEVIPTPFSRALQMVWRGEITDAKSALALLHANYLQGKT